MLNLIFRHVYRTVELKDTYIALHQASNFLPFQ